MLEVLRFDGRDCLQPQPGHISALRRIIFPHSEQNFWSCPIGSGAGVDIGQLPSRAFQRGKACIEDTADNIGTKIIRYVSSDTPRCDVTAVLVRLRTDGWYASCIASLLPSLE